MWPALGCLLNTGVYYCEQKRYGLVTVDKDGVRYWVVNGTLEKPTPPQWVVERENRLLVYAWVAQHGIGILFGEDLRIRYDWGEECNSLPNTVTFRYQMGDKKRFPGYVNQINMTRKYADRSEEERIAFMVAGQQNIEPNNGSSNPLQSIDLSGIPLLNCVDPSYYSAAKPKVRHVIAAVSGKRGTNITDCDKTDLDFFATFSDLRYFDLLYPYVKNHFGHTLDRDEMERVLNEANTCSKKCKKSNA